MATSAIASPYASSYAWPANQNISWPAPASAQPLGDRLSVSSGMHESIQPYPPNAGPEAGASAVIDAENDGLLSVAAVGTLVAGIAALGVPTLFELSGARLKNRLEKFEAANALKNDEAKTKAGSGAANTFETLEQDYRKDAEHAVAEMAGDKHAATLRSIAGGRPLTASELHDLRKNVALTLLARAHAIRDHETHRVLTHEFHMLEKLGPGDAPSAELPKAVRRVKAQQHELARYHRQRRAFRAPELAMHNRFAGLFDGIALAASGIEHVFHAGVKRPRPDLAEVRKETQVVERPRDAAAYYAKLAARKHPTVRALHTAAYIDQRWPGLLQSAAHANTASKDLFEVWIEHPIPARRVTTDAAIPESAQRVVAVLPHEPANDAALAKTGYSLGRELDVAHGNYGAFKAGPAAAKMRQIAHRYSIYLWGAKDTLANPKNMGMVLANLGVTSITLSALLYGMLYLTEYWKIESDLKKIH